MVVRKLKAAIYECVLAHSLCNAVTSTGPCGTPFRRRADSVLAQFLRLLSLMPRRLSLAASDIRSRQPNTVHQHAKFACDCDGRSAKAAALRNAEPPNPDAGILFGSCEKGESRLMDRAHCRVSALGDAAIPIRLA